MSWYIAEYKYIGKLLEVHFDILNYSVCKYLKRYTDSLNEIFCSGAFF